MADETKYIKCPACGENVEEGVENCPKCGAPVGVLDSGAPAAGTPIDNSAAINEMLHNSSLMVEEGKDLGVGDLDVEEDNDDTYGDSYQGPSTANIPADLTPEQKKQIEKGGIIELSPGGPNMGKPPAPAPAPARTPAPAPPAPEAALPGAETPKDPEALPGAAPTAAPAVKIKTSDTPMVIESADDDKSKRRKKEKGSPLGKIIAAVIGLIIGCAAGFFGKMFFFPDMPKPSCQDFAEQAATAVKKVEMSNGNNAIYVHEAYVSYGATATQCIIRATVDDRTTAETKWYRVKVENGSEDTVHVYMELDPEYYSSLKNSDLEEDRIKAAMLSSIQAETERCVTEIGNDSWQEANAAALNNTLNPFKVSEKTKEK